MCTDADNLFKGHAIHSLTKVYLHVFSWMVDNQNKQYPQDFFY